MKKRNPYKTAQQEAMLQYFLEDKIGRAHV